jgi:hypothetical protein
VAETQTPNAFKVCSFCARSGDDICDYRMWQNTDAKDKPVDDYMISCRDAACQRKIDDDPMLFIEVPWGAGGPGRFMLLCGDCPYRSGFACRHPSLKANGGSGLEVKFSSVWSGVIVCGSHGCQVMPTPATWCAGNPREV